MEQAILVVSFGTSYLDTLDKTIGELERVMKQKFPDRKFYRAFTSGVIIRKLKRLYGMKIDTVQEAMERMIYDGMEDIIVQPTHIINGEENDFLRDMVMAYQDRFHSLSFGKPLLTTVEDSQRVVDAMVSRLPEKTDDTIHIFLGHGTAHYANAIYSQLGWMFRDLGREDVWVGTVEGYPAIDVMLKRLSKLDNVRKISCRLLLIVAGVHAKEDLAGEDPKSWKSQLTAAGYQVECHLEGMGEWKEVQELFAEHADVSAYAISN